MSINIVDIPENPGVYIMKKKSVVIYVGKAKNLKNRVSSYFNREHENNKTRELVKNIEDIEYIICNSEIDALVLENNLIKQYSPKYNIALKDQKTYPYIKIGNEKFPSLTIVRTIRALDSKKGTYYGPYPHGAWNLKKALLRIFNIRDCNRDMEKKYLKPCLKYYMHFCVGPCVYKNIEMEYSLKIEGIKKILKGNGKEYTNEMYDKMINYSKDMKFEEALVLKNQIDELKNSTISQITELKNYIDEDSFVYKKVDENVFVLVLSYREGKIIGKNSVIISLKDKIYEDLNEMIIFAYYSKNFIPKNIVLEPSLEAYKSLMEKYFNTYSENNVELFFPKIKSRKQESLYMANLNLEKDIESYYKRKSVVEEGLLHIYKKLALKKYPRRIECFDISNISGKDAVASMSVAIEGIAKKSEYRKYKITCKDTPDDFAMMEEVITRRYSKLKESEFPDMILIDGGVGQINAVGKILKKLNKLHLIDLLSLAKKEELVYKYGEATPYVLDMAKESIKIFQRVRDEAHRFGVTYHRKLRSKRVVTSELNEIKGIGEKRKLLLISKFNSIKNIFEADIEQLKKIVPLRVALAIKEHEKKV
ncbi:MAG: excinuclease ABC subunit UvrC [Fusobacteriaceae bacterium]